MAERGSRRVRIRVMGNVVLIEKLSGGIAVVPLHSVCNLIRQLDLEVVEGELECPEVVKTGEVVETDSGFDGMGQEDEEGIEGEGD